MALFRTALQRKEIDLIGRFGQGIELLWVLPIIGDVYKIRDGGARGIVLIDNSK